MSSYLRLDGIHKHFGSVTAVTDLSLSIEEGEFFTLLGPSGCGKSTTLSLIAGLEAPSAGRIVLQDKDITRQAPEHRGVGVVFQSYALFPHMTVLENVMFPMRMRGFRKSDAVDRAREALALVQLSQESAYPSAISGGQAQRVAVARALVFEPNILLMDEPLAALDRRLRHDMQFELRALQRRIGATVIYVTHDQEEALVLSDRVAVMRAGRLEQVGDPHELYTAPRNAFVARFLGESNALPVTVVDRRGDTVLVAPDAAPDGPRLPVVRTSGDLHRGVFVVRPESVQMSSPEAATPPNHFGLLATIRDVVFLGDHFLVEAVAEGGIAVKAKTTNDQTERAAVATLRTQTMLLHWPVDAALLVADDATDDLPSPQRSRAQVPMLSHCARGRPVATLADTGVRANE